MKAHHHYSIHALLGVALAAAIALLLWGPGYAQQTQAQIQTQGPPSTTAAPSVSETVVVESEKHRLKPFDMEECYLDGPRECVRMTCVEWPTPTGWQRKCENHRDNHFP